MYSTISYFDLTEVIFFYEMLWLILNHYILTQFLKNQNQININQWKLCRT